jgi:hypothetical protein
MKWFFGFISPYLFGKKGSEEIFSFSPLFTEIRQDLSHFAPSEKVGNYFHPSALFYIQHLDSQCWGSESAGSACFWASRIPIH